MKELKRAGISQAAIDAAWPSWWSEELSASPSGRAELRFALARRLGLAPKPLLGERVEFVWDDEALFKHLAVKDATNRAALVSFGVSVGRMLLQATEGRTPPPSISAYALRQSILVASPYVDLHSLLSACWGLGVPVVHLRVFPLEAKSMHAMVVRWRERHAILLSRDASYPAPIAFTLAHELGHVLLRHTDGAPALVDLEDPALATDGDLQEREADRFALTLLTGSEQPHIETSTERFNAPMLAHSALQAAPKYRVEPGTLALCVGFQKNVWPVAMSALKFIYQRPMPIWPMINEVATKQLQWDSLGTDNADYLRNVMGING